MEISYNKTGAERKALVKAIGEILECEPIYKGAPSFSYKVSNYLIDKSGILKGKDNPDLVADLQGLYDFKAISEEYDTPLPEAEPVPDGIRIPYEADLGGRVSPYRDFEEPPAYGIPDSVEAPDHLIINMPRDYFTDAALDNLSRIIESKGDLIKKAIGANNLPIEVSDENVSFPWFTGHLTPDKVNAYSHFISALCAMAKSQQRVTAKAKETGNDKYTFRCFLLRLGFIGDEYKTVRKTLLENLSGNSAFRSSKEDSE